MSCWVTSILPSVLLPYVVRRGLRLGELSTGEGDRQRIWELGLFSPF